MIEKKFTENHFNMKIDIKKDFAVIYEGKPQDYTTELVGIFGINRAYKVCEKLNGLFEENERWENLAVEDKEHIEKLENAIKSVKNEIPTELWEDVFEDLV